MAEFPCKNYAHSTDIEGVCLNLKWTVKNFSKLLLGKCYKFPPFRPTPQCNLEVSFIKECVYVNDLCVFVENKFKSDVRFNARTTISDESGKQLFQEDSKNRVFEGTINILTGFRNRNVLPDSLIIDIKLELYNISSEKLDLSSHEIKKENITEDFINFILSEHPEEIKLKTKDAEIPANKAILRARSPVFHKMFHHPTSEKENNIVLVDDVSGSTLKILVDFLFSGKAELPETELQSMKELYYAADKYQVLELREICARTMLPLLKEENVVEIVVLAHRQSDKFLKDNCLIFIHTRIDALMGTEDWMKMKVSDPDLVVEIFETFWRKGAALQQKSE